MSEPLTPSTQPKDPQPKHLAEMTLFEHLAELRSRIAHSLIACALTSILAYLYSDLLFLLLNRPYYQAFGDSLLIGTGPAEAFVLKLKVSVFGGIVIASPYLFYQLWLFVKPGLYPKERQMIFPFVASTTLLFLVVVVFCYTLIFPVTFEFFHQQYQSIGITPAVRLSEHLSTTITGLLSFGIVFELPVLAFLLARLGVIDENTLKSFWRHAVVLIFIISAVLTPPDVLTQFLMAGPLLLLYGISIVIVRLAVRRSSGS